MTHDFRLVGLWISEVSQINAKKISSRAADVRISETSRYVRTPLLPDIFSSQPGAELNVGDAPGNRGVWMLAVAGSLLAVAILRRITLDPNHKGHAGTAAAAQDPCTAAETLSQDEHVAAPSDPSPADWRLLRHNVAWEATIAALLAVAVFVATAQLEDNLNRQAENRILRATARLEQRLDRQADIRENVRFVRQSIMDDSPTKPFQGLDLGGASLAALDLSCKSRARETGCANLIEADLADANMAFVILRGATLSLADMREADIHSADLNDANLYATDLRGANLSFTSLRGADLSSADLRGADLTAALPVDADLSAANLRHADLRGVDLRGADLTSARLAKTDLKTADLSNANLAYADLRGAEIEDVCFDEATVWPVGVTEPAEPLACLPPALQRAYEHRPPSTRNTERAP